MYVAGRRGISFVKKKIKMFAVGTFGLLSIAIVYHGIYNILIQSDDGHGRLINYSLMNSTEDAVRFRAENLYDGYNTYYV